MSQSLGKPVYLLKVSIQVPPCRHGVVTQGLGTDETECIAVRMERTNQGIQAMCQIRWTCMKQTTISIDIMLSAKQRDHRYIMEIVHY